MTKTKPPAPTRRGRGRPAIDPADRLLPTSVRLNAEHRAKLAAVGIERLREWLDRVKVAA